MQDAEAERARLCSALAAMRADMEAVAHAQADMLSQRPPGTTCNCALLPSLKSCIPPVCSHTAGGEITWFEGFGCSSSLLDGTG